MTAAIYVIVSLCLGVVLGDNATESCLLPWEAALEDWATADSAVQNTRHGRIMALPPSQGYYVSDRIDLVPPPPPPSYMSHHYRPQQMFHRGPYPAAPVPPPPSSPRPQSSNSSYPSGLHPPGPPPAPSTPYPYPPPAPNSASPAQYDEWQASPPPPHGAGKIVNRPPNPYKDQFKPSYPPPSPGQPPIPVNSVDRVDAVASPPHKQVSETDVYLLRAIEKLVYRVDLMEKRMRKMEENVHYIVAGAEAKPEPCQSNFTRVGAGCYHVSSEALNWKGASYACRKLKGNLLELDEDERKSFVRGLLGDKNLKASDFWTGGLNPGLLWIWSHSAKPVMSNTTDSSSSIQGEGRCLALVSTGTDFSYRGQDCALRHRYVCEKYEDKEKLGNEIERVARKMRSGRRAKIMWSDDN